MGLVMLMVFAVIFNRCDNRTDVLGLLYIMLAVLCNTVGSLSGEYILKADAGVSLLLQVILTMPSELLTIFGFGYISRDFSSHGNFDPLHDFNWVTWAMMTGMGIHAINSCLVVKALDALLKQIAQVSSIIFPTFVVLVLMGAETFQPARLAAGASIISLAGTFAVLHQTPVAAPVLPVPEEGVP